MSKDFELVEENAIDSPVENIKWYGKEDETPQVDFQDKGKGETVVLRLFEFKLPPNGAVPTKEQILTPDYIRHLQATLWADDLRLIMEPRVAIDKESIKIFAPCQAKAGATILDNPKLLQEWTKQ